MAEAHCLRQCRLERISASFINMKNRQAPLWKSAGFLWNGIESRCWYFSLGASPPRICRSDLLMSSTTLVWADGEGVMCSKRSVTSVGVKLGSLTTSFLFYNYYYFVATIYNSLIKSIYFSLISSLEYLPFCS